MIQAMVASNQALAIRAIIAGGSRTARATLSTGPMHDADAIEIQALKADSFGRIALMRDAGGAVRASRSAPRAAVAALAGVVAGATRSARPCAASPACAATPQLLRWDGRVLDRSYLDGAAMYQRPPRGDRRLFPPARAACCRPCTGAASRTTTSPRKPTGWC